MFAELIFALFASVIFFIIDSFNTSIGILTCGLTVYFYGYFSLRVLERDLIDVFLIAKILLILFYFFQKVNNFYSFIKNIFFAQKSSNSSVHYSSEHCNDKASLENEINTIASKILQHYICTWYNKFTENEEFVSDLNSLIKDTLTALSTTISKVDRSRFSYIILQVYLHYLIHFTDMKKRKIAEFDCDNFEMKHWATKDHITEWCYLESLISTLLDSFGPIEYHNSMHSKSSPLLHTVVVEILTENVLYPLVNVLTDPDHLNSWIFKLLIKDCVTEMPGLPTSSLENNISVSEEQSLLIGPRIFLTSEDDANYSDQISTISMEDTLATPHCDIIVENDMARENSLRQIENSFAECYKRTRDPNDLLSYFASGRKSSSNITLIDNDDSKINATELTSTVMCDGPIKRSKSADYIQQMPQLKPLNEQNYNIILHRKDNRMMVALKSDINSTDIEQAEEAIEIPPLFTDVRITGTQQKDEPGHSYTLYCIEYTGVFHDTAKSSETPQFVKLTINIKRRFREFDALQSRLENNPALRNSLKGIKGPSKWLATPFSNLDKRNIAERKTFLENYLQELCGQNAIACSSELQEFLAYGGDASIAFVKKGTDISVPRIDKMLFRGVKGAFDLIRTALPNNPAESGCSKETVPIPRGSCDGISSDRKFQEHLLDYSSRELELMDHVKNYFKYFDENSSSESVYDCFKFTDAPSSRRSSLLRHACTPNVPDSCKCSETWSSKAAEYVVEENLFGDVVIDIMSEVMQINLLKFQGVIHLFKLLLSPAINRYIENKLNGISEKSVSTSLHMLHKILWPEESILSVNAQSPNFDDLEKQIAEHFEGYFMSNAVTRNLSGIFKKPLLDRINVFILSLQYPKLNRCLLYYLFDVIIETLCSKEM